MKSLFILIFFIIVSYITYNYSYQKFYSSKIKKDIKFLIMPIMVDDFFKYKSLEDLYRNIFNKQSININYSIETKKEKEIDTEINTNFKNKNKNKNKKFSLQRYFTQF